MRRIKAFVARSFDQEDEIKVGQIQDFLETFRAAGFLPESADRAEVESVSKKVRDLIDESDVFVGIFTRRHRIYPDKMSRMEALSRVFGFSLFETRINEQWTAPPWVIQESGYALKSIGNEKKLILFLESGVVFPLLQGDLEYIPFDGEDVPQSFAKASQMINALIAEASGTVVETIVRSSPPAPDKDPSSVQLEQDANPSDLILSYYGELEESVEAKDWERSRIVYEKGLILVQQERPTLGIAWKASYQRFRYCSGQSDGLNELETLARQNPDSPSPFFALGVCFNSFQEYGKAAEYFIKAAGRGDAQDQAGNLVAAAKALKKCQRSNEALKLLVDISRVGTSDVRVAKEIYALLKDGGEYHLAFAVAEEALKNNPSDSEFRFSLAYDYGEHKFDELCLFHYLVLRENKPDYLNVLNNLGVAYSELEFLALSIDSYEAAFKNGVTISADNLARAYLSVGFTSAAAKLIREAMKIEGYEPQLGRTLAAIAEQRKKEEERQKELIRETEKARRFLLKLGQGYFQTVRLLEGDWEFPEGIIPLRFVGPTLTGNARQTVELQPSAFYGSLLGSTPGPGEKRQEIRMISFSGKMNGRACKFDFETTVSTKEGLTAVSINSLMGGGGKPTTVNGYIIFSEDGTSGEVCELKNGKPDRFYTISNLDSLPSGPQVSGEK